MNVLITGGEGQLGWELQRKPPAGWTVTALNQSELDISNPKQVAYSIASLSPDLVINTAAYTAVDRAEQESRQAYAVNSDGAEHVARTTQEHGARLVHISTDFVFDGCSHSPYPPYAELNPTGVYGASKMEGERKVMNATDGKAIVLRTAWVYSVHGQNFVKSMLHLMQDRENLKVVADQIGTPTWAAGLAGAIWCMAGKPEVNGSYHWTDAGVASWYDFAVAIEEEAVDLGLLQKSVAITPVSTEEYPMVAQRPSFSVLDKTSMWKVLGTRAPHWRVSLRRMLRHLKSGNGYA